MLASVIPKEIPDKARQRMLTEEQNLVERAKAAAKGVGKIDREAISRKVVQGYLGIIDDDLQKLAITTRPPEPTVKPGRLDPAALDDKQKLAYAQLLHAKRLLASGTFDPQAVYKAALKESASSFGSKEEAKAMLSRWLDEPVNNAPPATAFTIRDYGKTGRFTARKTLPIAEAQEVLTARRQQFEAILEQLK